MPNFLCNFVSQLNARTLFPPQPRLTTAPAWATRGTPPIGREQQLPFTTCVRSLSNASTTSRTPRALDVSLSTYAAAAAVSGGFFVLLICLTISLFVRIPCSRALSEPAFPSYPPAVSPPTTELCTSCGCEKGQTWNQQSTSAEGEGIPGGYHGVVCQVGFGSGTYRLGVVKSIVGSFSRLSSYLLCFDCLIAAPLSSRHRRTVES